MGRGMENPFQEASSWPAVEAATPEFDDDARRQLVTACRQVRPDVTDAEIGEFTERKKLFVTTKRKRNIVRFLLTAVPNSLEGEALLRYRKTKAEKYGTIEI